MRKNLPNSEQSFIYLDIKKVCEPLISFKRIMSAKLHSSGLNKAGGKHRKKHDRRPRLLHFRDEGCIGRPKKTISVSLYWCFNLQPRTIYRAYDTDSCTKRGRSLGKAFSPERYDRSLATGTRRFEVMPFEWPCNHFDTWNI